MTISYRERNPKKIKRRKKALLVSKVEELPKNRHFFVWKGWLRVNLRSRDYRICLLIRLMLLLREFLTLMLLLSWFLLLKVGFILITQYAFFFLAPWSMSHVFCRWVGESILLLNMKDIWQKLNSCDLWSFTTTPKTSRHRTWLVCFVWLISFVGILHATKWRWENRGCDGYSLSSGFSTCFFIFFTLNSDLSDWWINWRKCEGRALWCPCCSNERVEYAHGMWTGLLLLASACILFLVCLCFIRMILSGIWISVDMALFHMLALAWDLR